MSAPSIILPKPLVLIHQAGSLLGINYTTSPLRSAIIDNIYATSDLYVVGDYVVFDPANAKQIMYASTLYYLIDEKFIFGNEGMPVIT